MVRTIIAAFALVIGVSFAIGTIAGKESVWVYLIIIVCIIGALLMD
jgi:hypothetical protein